MMANLKRLWDTENKKIVWAIPTSEPYKKLQVWTNNDGSKLYVYRNSQYIELDTSNNAVAEYGHYWKELDDEMVGYYLTSEPTNLYNRDEGDKVSYTFVDWDGTVLKSGTVDEGETPTAPADPTRAATAQYTYTFAGWNPEVAKITKRTTYTATYTATVNQYDITFVDEDGTTELDSQELDYGATPVYAGETPTKEATAQYTYTFSGWTPDIAPVTGDATYTATYSYTVNQYTATIESDDTEKGTVDVSEVTADYGTSISAEANVLTIGTTIITATAETGYVFSSWGTLPETLTEDVTITATFVATTIPVTAVTIEEGTTVTAEVNSNVTFSLDVTPGNANDVSTLSATVSDDTKCSVNIFYQEGNGVRCMIIGLAEGTADVTIYCSGVSQGVIGVTVTAPL